MRLSSVLKEIDYKEIYGNREIVDITDISINSKKITRGSLFTAIVGFKQDGHDYAVEAVKNGAAVVVAHKKMELPSNIVQIIVKDTRAALPLISRNFFKDPSRSLKIIGITGTNGKTTTCYLINSMLKNAGFKTSMITTFKSYIDEKEVHLDRTTPESPDLHKFFNESLAGGVQFVSMEVSSHSIDLHRVDHIDFDYFIFTNLSQDHLDYHGTLAQYFEVKSRLFDGKNKKIYGDSSAIINIDDGFGKQLYRMTGLKKISYSIEDPAADIRASGITSSISGIEMIIEKGKQKAFRIKSSLCGVFNIYNILAAVSTGLEIGLNEEQVKAGPESMRGFGGRFEKIDYGPGPTVIIDYAHTPDGLENVLKTAKEVLGRGGRLISVFGCGGDRDKKKRKIMGSISAGLADYTIITSDNPRSEVPDNIIAMIEEGFLEKGITDYTRITDRKKAIFSAMDMAEDRDLVLIAGKGHEDYQEFENGRRIPFCDSEIVRRWNNENKRKN